MNEEIAKKLHAIRGSLSVVKGFMRVVDKEGLDSSGQHLYDICNVSLDKIVVTLDEIQKLAANRQI